MNKIVLILALLLPMGYGANVQMASAKEGYIIQAENNRITEKEAEEIALKKVKGEVINIKLETDDNREYYEVIIKSTDSIYEIEIDAKTGQVIEVEKEKGPEDGNHDDDHQGDDDHLDD